MTSTTVQLEHSDENAEKSWVGWVPLEANEYIWNDVNLIHI